MSQNENKEPEKQPLEEEKELQDDFVFSDEEGEISPEFDQFLEEQGADEFPSELETGAGEESSDLDNLMNDWGEDDEDLAELGLDIEEEERDPLKEYEGEPNSKNLERLGTKFLDKADLFKADLCSKLGGQHIAEYVADDEMKEILIECIKEYLATKEVSELTPFGALMAALAMWTLPSLGIALLDRFQLKKETKTANTKKTSKNLNEAATEIETTEVIEEEAQTDYSHLREFQEQRKIFELNKEGKYRRTAKGTYIKIEIAKEYPSPQIKEWLDEGKNGREIRNLLGYG